MPSYDFVMCSALSKMSFFTAENLSGDGHQDNTQSLVSSSLVTFSYAMPCLPPAPTALFCGAKCDRIDLTLPMIDSCQRRHPNNPFALVLLYGFRAAPR